MICGKGLSLYRKYKPDDDEYDDEYDKDLYIICNKLDDIKVLKDRADSLNDFYSIIISSKQFLDNIVTTNML